MTNTNTTSQNRQYRVSVGCSMTPQKTMRIVFGDINGPYAGKQNVFLSLPAVNTTLNILAIK